jgi:DNA-binding Xre family transcriptional regulator
MANIKAPAAITITGVIGSAQNLWQRVNAALDEREWSFAELAAKCHCSHQYLRRRFEGGKLRAEFFLRICKVLDLSVSDILATEGWIPPPKPPAPTTTETDDRPSTRKPRTQR